MTKKQKQQKGRKITGIVMLVLSAIAVFALCYVILAKGQTVQAVDTRDTKHVPLVKAKQEKKGPSLAEKKFKMLADMAGTMSTKPADVVFNINAAGKRTEHDVAALKALASYEMTGSAGGVVAPKSGKTDDQSGIDLLDYIAKNQKQKQQKTDDAAAPGLTGLTEEERELAASVVAKERKRKAEIERERTSQAQLDQGQGQGQAGAKNTDTGTQTAEATSGGGVGNNQGTDAQQQQIVDGKPTTKDGQSNPPPTIDNPILAHI